MINLDESMTLSKVFNKGNNIDAKNNHQNLTQKAIYVLRFVKHVQTLNQETTITEHNHNSLKT